MANEVNQYTGCIFKLIRFCTSNDPKFNDYYKNGNYIEYITRFEKGKEPLLIFNWKNGDTIDYKTAKKMLEKLNKDQIFWDTVLSFSEEQSKLLNLTDPNILRAVIQYPIKDFLVKSNFDPDKLNVFYTLHTDTKHIHIHLGFFEKEKTFINKNGEKQFKKIGKIKLPIIDQLKTDIDYKFISFEPCKEIENKKEELKSVIKNNIDICDFNNSDIKCLVNFFDKKKLKKEDLVFKKLPRFIKDTTLKIFSNLVKNNAEIKNKLEECITLFADINKREQIHYQNANQTEKLKHQYKGWNTINSLQNKINNLILKTIYYKTYLIKKSIDNKKNQKVIWTNYKNKKSLSQIILGLIDNEVARKQKYLAMQKYYEMKSK